MLLPPAAETAKAKPFKVIYTFCFTSGCPSGFFPIAGVVEDSEGNLFGTTFNGGLYNGGTVFEMTPSGSDWQFRVLHAFVPCPNGQICPDGARPRNLLLGTDGNIYGTTDVGGIYNNGSVFELTPDEQRTNWTLHTLHRFNAADGSSPSSFSYPGSASGTPYDGKSPLYGTTPASSPGSGTIYELTPETDGSWTEKTL